MKNANVLLDAADYIDAHPDDYKFDWPSCVAAHLAIQAGFSVTQHGDVIGDLSYGSNRHVSNWGERFLDLSLSERENLFVFMRYDDGYIINHDDPHEVAKFVRWFVMTHA